jgi:tetratricopeptide (TPR) repeat protein
MPEDAARSYLIAGDTYWKRGRPEEARERWERAASLLPQLIGPHERLVMYHQWRDDTGGIVRHYLVLADLLSREGRCLMALHTCYLALSLEPENRLVWAATDKAWSCVAARDGAGKGQEIHVETGGLVNAAAEFAQWQLSAEFHQRSLQNKDGVDAVRDDFLRQAMIHEGHGRAGLAIQFYEKAIAVGLNSPAIFFAVGLLYRLVGRHSDAQSALTLAGRHPFYRRVVELLDEND